jgi:hypothetical protein
VPIVGGDVAIFVSKLEPELTRSTAGLEIAREIPLVLFLKIPVIYRLTVFEVTPCNPGIVRQVFESHAIVKPLKAFDATRTDLFAMTKKSFKGLVVNTVKVKTHSMYSKKVSMRCMSLHLTNDNSRSCTDSKPIEDVGSNGVFVADFQVCVRQSK